MKKSFWGSTFKSLGQQQSARVQIDEKDLIPVEAITFTSEIGEGSSARVYQDSFNTSTVALKKFKLGKGIPKYEEMLRKEAKNLLCLTHCNVVACLGICVPEMTLVLEFCGKSLEINGQYVMCHTVRQMVDAIGDALPEDLKLEALYQTAHGMAYLHQKGIVDCDLKSQNILVSSDDSCADEWVLGIRHGRGSCCSTYNLQVHHITYKKRCGWHHTISSSRTVSWKSSVQHTY